MDPRSASKENALAEVLSVVLLAYRCGIKRKMILIKYLDFKIGIFINNFIKPLLLAKDNKFHGVVYRGHMHRTYAGLETTLFFFPELRITE